MATPSADPALGGWTGTHAQNESHPPHEPGLRQTNAQSSRGGRAKEQTEYDSKTNSILSGRARRIAEAERFLSVLDEEADSFCFQIFDDNPQRKDPHLARAFHGALPDLFDTLDALNQQGAGIFVTVNEVAPGAPRKAENIIRVRAVFGDFDPPKTAAAPSQYPLPPVMEVESSPGKTHAYWTVDDMPLADFTPTQRSLTEALGSDPKPIDLPRVMRLPGFRHMKDPQHPHWVRVIADDPRLPYNPEAIARAFPPVVRGSKTGGKADTDGSPIPEGGRNAHLASLAGTMRRRGMTPGAILAALMAENEARCRPPLYSDEVERIAASVSRYAPGQGDTGGTPQGDGAALGAGHAVPFLKLVSMDSLMVRRPPLRYAIDGYLPRQLVTLLGAHGGLGKSYLALAFAAHVACGRDFSGRAAYCGRALYVSLEDDEDMVLDRLRRIVLAYGLDPEAVKANVTIVTGTHGDCAMAVEGGYSKRLTATKVMDEVKAAAAGYSLVVIDNASDGFAGNENDRSQVRGFMRMLADIGRSSGAAVLLLAHIDKAAARYGSQNNSYSGSTAWHNSARSRLALTSDDKSEVIELVQEKLNVGRKAPPLLMTWTDDAVLVPGTLPGAPGGREATERSTQDADAVLGALRAAEAVSVNVPPGRQGSSTAFRVLETFDELPTSLRGAKGKDRFWAAMNLLLARGIVVVEPYKSHDRKDRQRLRLFTGRAYSEPASTGTCADTAAPRQSPIPPSDIGAGARQYAGCGIGADMAQMGAKAQPSKTVRTNDTTDDEAEAF